MPLPPMMPCHRRTLEYGMGIKVKYEINPKVMMAFSGEHMCNSEAKVALMTMSVLIHYIDWIQEMAPNM
jgi:hypothetical protein